MSESFGKLPEYPSFIDGEIVLGTHCFCGYVGFPNGDRTFDLNRYREHLKYCEEYKKWIDGIFPPAYLSELPYGAILGNNYLKNQPRNKHCIHCDYNIHASIPSHNGITHYQICVRCKKPFNVEDSKEFQEYLVSLKKPTKTPYK